MWDVLEKIEVLLSILTLIWTNKKARKNIKRLGKKAIKITQTPLYAKIFGIVLNFFILVPIFIVLICLQFTLEVLKTQNIPLAITKAIALLICGAGFIYCNYRLYYPSKKLLF